MGINEWWAADTRERFWMEITNRESVGVNLIAPKLNDRELPEWSYDMVRLVRPGDVVLHWRKNHGPALTGYSHCSKTAVDSSLEWQSRGTYGRTHAFAGEEDAWEAQLQGYREFKSPVDLARIRELEPIVRDVRDGLATRQSGSSLYFPFALSERRPIRAAQAYLVKFPAALVDAIPELRELGQVTENGGDEHTAEARQRNRGSTRYGRQSSAERRKAVEQYSMQQVLDHYQRLGYSTEDVGATGPWDITARRDDEVLHIEVKGSTQDRLSIDITEGEVRHAEGWPTVLVVIDQIHMNELLECSGGRWRHWPSWIPDRNTLMATSYQHPLPGEARDGKP